LGEVRLEEFRGNELSKIVEQCWLDLPNHYEHCVLDEFIIMPNHVHGIVVIIKEKKGLQPVHGLPEIVRAFKSFSAKRINMILNRTGKPFWQKGYYEHVIRSPEEMDRIREYIADNPLKWDLERNGVENLKL